MSLREKAITAYEASELKKLDMLRKKALITEISHFFHRTELASVTVNDNPFRIDDLLFYASELRIGSDRLYGYQVDVSRRCDGCGEHLELTVSKRFIDKDGLMTDSKDSNVGPAQFGRWLLEPHLCEFSLERRKAVKGFAKE